MYVLSQERRTRSRRALAAAALTVLAALVLTACFVVPLSDGRSPFDDPNGTSFAELEEAVPLVQAAVDTTAAAEAGWGFRVTGESENCEGACNLHVLVEILPPSNADEFAQADPATFSNPTQQVPADVLAQTLVAAADAGESASVNVRVSASWSDAFTLPGSSVEYYREGSLADAISELFPDASIGTHGEAYWIADSPVHGLQVVLNTRDVSDVSEALGLG